MDTSSVLELIHFQINNLEIIYQIGVNRNIVNRNSMIKKKRNWQKIFFKKPLGDNFLKNYFLKINFFSLPVVQLKPWFFFWFSNSLDLFGKTLNPEIMENMKKNLIKISTGKGSRNYLFLNSESLISVFSSLMALFCLSTSPKQFKKDYRLIIFIFLKKLAFSPWFRNSLIGEVDSRTIFCTLVISSFMDFFTSNLTKNFFFDYENIFNSDGAFGSDKFDESHGALSFCAVGSFIFFSGKNYSKNLFSTFEIWFLKKIKPFEFSAQGRTPKTPDSCYLFWLCGISIICDIFLPIEFIDNLVLTTEKKFEGFSDQPGKILDLYHTCYFLSGLSLLNFVQKKKKISFRQNQVNFMEFFFPKINPLFGIREIRVLSSLIE